MSATVQEIRPLSNVCIDLTTNGLNVKNHALYNLVSCIIFANLLHDVPFVKPLAITTSPPPYDFTEIYKVYRKVDPSKFKLAYCGNCVKDKVFYSWPGPKSLNEIQYLANLNLKGAPFLIHPAQKPNQSSSFFTQEYAVDWP